MSKQYYLDSNAHVKLSNLIPQIYTQYSDYLTGHPLAFHAEGRKAANLIEACREKIANLLGAKQKDQIIFTRGTSQAIEWGLELFKNFGTFSFSDLEHFSVIDKIDDLQNKNIYSQFVELEKNTFDMKSNRRYSLVHLLAHNETGIIYDLNSLQKKHIFSDCAQIIGKMNFSLQDYNFDYATFSPHKFGGPAGIGILYLQDLSSWKEFGTGSRYNLDITGTPDAFSILATAEILDSVIKEQNEKIEKMKEFQTTIEKGLKELNCEIIAEHLTRLPNTTFLKLSEKWSTTEMKLKLIQNLEEKNIYPGLGSACGSIHNFSNRTMQALGYPESSDNYLRISTFGEYNSKDAQNVTNTFSDILLSNEY